VKSGRSQGRSTEPATATREVGNHATLTAAWLHFLDALRDARQATRSPGGLSLAQYRLLLPLRDGGCLHRVGELADSAEIRGPTASRMLDGLARQGLVERVCSLDDKRHVQVFLTPLGADVLQAKHEQIEAAWQHAFDQLSDEEREHAARFLRLIAARIRGL
jgi:MarR family transcriptional regulator, organic hydroperoxide resistance regulator